MELFIDNEKSSISHSKLATGLKARLNIDEDLLKDIRNEDIIKSAPFVYKNLLNITNNFL